MAATHGRRVRAPRPSPSRRSPARPRAPPVAGGRPRRHDRGPRCDGATGSTTTRLAARTSWARRISNGSVIVPPAVGGAGWPARGTRACGSPAPRSPDPSRSPHRNGQVSQPQGRVRRHIARAFPAHAQTSRRRCQSGPPSGPSCSSMRPISRARSAAIPIFDRRGVAERLATLASRPPTPSPMLRRRLNGLIVWLERPPRPPSTQRLLMGPARAQRPADPVAATRGCQREGCWVLAWLG